MKTVAIVQISAGRIGHGRFRPVACTIAFLLCAFAVPVSAAGIDDEKEVLDHFTVSVAEKRTAR